MRADEPPETVFSPGIGRRLAPFALSG